MIWVDVAQTALTSLPAVVAVWVVGVDPGSGQLWPLIGLAAIGAFGAIGDALRWVFTRYRITPSHVELKTGVLVRRHRSIQRDRIRSVDVEARLRHRVAGLRVVNIGAGQQSAAGESALALDAIIAGDAEALRRLLLRRATAPAETSPDGQATDTPAASGPITPDPTTPIAVFARFEPRWLIYNIFNVWAYAVALGIGWGGYWLLITFGVDVEGFVAGLLDWEAMGWAWTIVTALLVVGAFGVLGLALSYVTEYWNFELARVPGEKSTLLRTRQGLFTTREINRDDKRMRGVQISEPLLWRWLGVSDTTVVTTGLNMWSMAQPAAILPRGPVTMTRQIAGAVLDAEANPLDAPLAAHPRAALRRRLWWATATSAVAALLLTWLAATDVVPATMIWVAAALWPCALVGAVIAYRALGHAIVGPYLVTRSGLISRATTVLQRSAVSTIVIRESLLQRRLGLRSVATMTAAGYGGYDTPDLEAGQSLAFANQAAPGLLTPFLRTPDAPSD